MTGHGGRVSGGPQVSGGQVNYGEQSSASS